MRRLAVIVFACMTVGACASPEATRHRGGGAGADPGNRPAQVKMHEGSRQYWKTPVPMKFQGPTLAPSEQARRLSLPRASTAQGTSAGGGTDR